MHSALLLCHLYERILLTNNVLYVNSATPIYVFVLIFNKEA